MATSAQHNLYFLPEPLASAIAVRAELWGLASDVLLLPLLAGISSRIHPESRLLIGTGFSVSPALWVALVGESGTLKTPILSLTCGSPLFQLEKQKHQEWQQEYAAWKAANRKTRKSGGDDESLPEPIHQEMIILDTRRKNKLLRQLAKQKRGVLLHLDFNFRGSSLRKYLKDLGGVSQIWRGKRISKMIENRSSGNVGYIDVKSPLVCMAGEIYPRELKRRLSNPHELSFWLRYLFSYVEPEKRHPLLIADEDHDETDPTADMEALLFRTYSHAHEIGKTQTQYTLNADAVDLFREFDRIIVRWFETKSARADELWRGTYHKLLGKTGRLAMALRMLTDAFEQRPCPTSKIDANCASGAIRLAERHLNDLMLITC